jgi:signal transduction histidine kinase/ligand-binding sensor domain-containing protein/DNA-binding response OmpR family regulator
MIIRWLASIWFIAACSHGFCQVRDYPFSALANGEGVSDNHVNTIFKDHRGFIWFGTQSGLNRYDGYSVKVFRHDDADPTSLADGDVEGIFEGPEDKLFVNTGIGGISVYDPVTGAFVPHADAYLQARHIKRYGLVRILHGYDGHFYFTYRDSGIYRFEPGKGAIRIWANTFVKSPVSDVAQDASGGLWVSYYNGLLERRDLATGTVSMHMDRMRREEPKNSYRYKMYVDHRGDLWLYEPDNLSGLWNYNPKTGGLRHFCRDSGTARLSTNNISDVVEDNKGLIWIATDKGGVDILDGEKLTIRNLRHSDEDRSLIANTITSLYADDIGAVWLGTLKNGVCYYQPNMLRFPLYRRQPGQPESLPYNDVSCFAEDSRGNLWIGTDGGGLIYFDRAANRFVQYHHDPGNPNSLSADAVVTLAMDRTGCLWIGTYQGGLDRYEGGKFFHYRHDDANPSSLADDRVYSIREDPDGDIWVGTMDHGLDRLDRSKGTFYHNTVDIPHTVHSNYIPTLAEDSSTDLWVGTAYGIDVLVRNTGQFIYYTTESSKLSDNIVNGMMCDHRGNMWVATRNGLSVLQKGVDTFQVFHIKDGLPSNMVLDIVEDKDHLLWASTSGGLARIAVSEKGNKLGIDCLNFDQYDGLQGRAFNEHAAFRTREGELVFGGAGGFNLFRPEEIRRNEHVPPVVLTGLQLYNEEVPLPPSVRSEGKLVLTYNQNNFTLEFAALSYINAGKDRYAYQLVGLDKDWMTTDGRNRRAAYTNIDPGEYTFRVRASNSDGVWNKEGITLTVIVRPPFWKTGWAYALYIVAILSLLYFGRVQVLRRARARFALAEERREVSRVHELDRMKIKFFTNLSHEFRTPLTLILSPVDKLIRGEGDPGKRQLAMTIERNARRLLHLVNQLLDLRKMEVNELKLTMSRGDVASFIRATVDSFTDLAAERGITLIYRTDVDQLSALFDKDKVERILFNLLSNAFKFTSPGGSIEVALATLEKDEQGVLLELKVKDTGIGIPAGLQEKIFESFFQADSPGPIRNQGTGIGLAITREFVEMHGGTIKVESVPDKGSCFTVLLPVTVLQGEPAAPVEPVSVIGRDMPGPALRAPLGGTRGFKVLLVEDDEDFRFYLKDNLASLFTVLEAANGKEGWQKTLSAQPDLVVSDVNMPLMDGLELCKKIKSDERVQHVPVILLTALSAEEDQLRALGMGANDYISKPFNVEILVSRIHNLLKFKEYVEGTLKRRVEVAPEEIEEEPEKTGEDFVREAVQVLEKNIANTEFSVDEWSREMGLSRTSLYKKILLATGLTPISFIRDFRMKRAAQLLEKTRHNVAEVAYMVGFNNPKYFARYFKEVFGILPSAYQAEKRKKK